VVKIRASPLSGQNCVKLSKEQKNTLSIIPASGIDITGKAQYSPKILEVRNNEDLVRRIGTKGLFRRWDTPTMKRFGPGEESFAMTIRSANRKELRNVQVG
jgi:hypothetical protein